MRPVIPSIILGEVEYNLIGLELSIIIPTLIPKSQYPHIGWITLQLLNQFVNGHHSFSDIESKGKQLLSLCHRYIVPFR
jgi:hypothetical protein